MRCATSLHTSCFILVLNLYWTCQEFRWHLRIIHLRRRTATADHCQDGCAWARRWSFRPRPVEAELRLNFRSWRTIWSEAVIVTCDFIHSAVLVSSSSGSFHWTWTLKQFELLAKTQCKELVITVSRPGIPWLSCLDSLDSLGGATVVPSHSG